MLVIDSGDAIRGIAEVASKLSFTISGYVGTTATSLAQGQIGSSEGNLYASGADGTVVTGITVVNTDSVTRTFTLYFLESGGGTSWAITPVSLDLGIGYSLYTDGQRVIVMDALGNVLSTVTAPAHALGSSTHTADTLSNLNTKVSDATLVDATAISSEIDGDISTHAGLADPHTGYRLESADHSHRTTGAQAGKIDHGLALNGLGDDDHTQYILKTLLDAQSMVMAVSDNTPVVLTVAASRFVGRKASGNIAAMTGAEALAVLSGQAAAGFSFNSQEITNAKLNALVLKGTFTNDGTVVLPAFTAGGDISMGANRLKTTNLLLREQDAGSWRLRNVADGADTSLLLATLYPTENIIFQASAKSFQAPTATNSYLIGRARETGVGDAEIWRMVGAAVPYFSIGGSQEFKFYNNGLATFGAFTLEGAVTLNGQDLIMDTSTGTKIGTAANQKIGFFGDTPVVQLAKASYNSWASLGDVVNALVAIGLFDVA